MTTADRSPHARRPAGFGVAVAVLLFGGPALADEPTPKRIAINKDRRYLTRVKDFTELRVGGSPDSLPEQEYQRDQEAFDALVLNAHEFTAAELDAAARRDVPLAALLDKDDQARNDVRYELVRFEGKLKRLVKIGSTPGVKAGGVDELYEAWVYPTGGPKTPVCFIVSEVPAGVVPSTDITPGLPVSGCGYFMKVVEYPSYEPDPATAGKTLRRRAPLLVGRAVLSGTAAPTAGGGLDGLLTVSLAVGGGVILALFLFAAWMRRTDRGVRRAGALRRKNPYPDGPLPPVWEQPPPDPPAPAGDAPTQS